MLHSLDWLHLTSPRVAAAPACRCSGLRAAQRRCQRQDWNLSPSKVVFVERLCSPISTQCTARSPTLEQPNQEPAQQPHREDVEQYCVVNFYHLVDVDNPQQLVEEHKAWVAQHGLDIRGRIYYSAQGVNAQFGGTRRHALQYVAWLEQQPLWQGLRYSVWPSPAGHAFPKLRLKYKPNLISLACGLQDLPVTTPEARATPLSPAEWKDMIATAQAKKVVVLDVRNDYEWDAGHFVGAGRPDEEEFAETPVGLDDQDLPQPLKAVTPDTPVMMYCTGGIRCDIYSTLLKSRGFHNLYTLEGGVQNYLRQEGSDHWKGSLYVFDGRMAISPQGAAALDGEGTLEAAAAAGHPLPAAVPCQVCGTGEAQLPHVNCANIDCNELFIACKACKARYCGCCCEDCMSAPRLLRPAKLDGGLYGSWGNYASEESFSEIIATGRRREGRVARRERRREAMRTKRARQIEERHALKAAMREAMARRDEQQAEAEHSQQRGASERSSARLAQLLIARRNNNSAVSSSGSTVSADRDGSAQVV